MPFSRPGGSSPPELSVSAFMVSTLPSSAIATGLICTMVQMSLKCLSLPGLPAWPSSLGENPPVLHSLPAQGLP